MKYSIVTILLLYSIQSLSQAAEESQMIKDGQCIPFRDSNTGSITKYICDKNQVSKMQKGRYENLGLQKKQTLKFNKGDVVQGANGEQVESAQKAMELYNTMKTTGETKLQVAKQNPLLNKIKSCLAGIYTGQIKFYESKKSYTLNPAEFGLSSNMACNGLDVSAEFANEIEFKVVAKSNTDVWSVDEKKMITQIQ